MLIYYILVLVSHLLYLYHFFPVSLNLTNDVIQPPQALYDIKFNISEFHKPKIDTLVFIVIDALRIDFINNENMPHLVSAATQNGCFLNVTVESPTVTMPRIKSITTGNIPQFVDMVLNLASTETIADSFLHQADFKNKKIVFYGDETWLQLYPKMFLRSEGTSSFFVNDFTEVDENVTRHLEQELKNEDWDIMFLHYLGLDHIGHVYGPYSSLVPGKLKEMDEVFHKLNAGLKHRIGNVMYIVTGDHGMKDSGGHGGSTFSETNVPFVVHGINCSNATVAQTDITPTLSTLMGLNIPACSIGKLIINMLQSLTIEQQLYAFLYNSLILNNTEPKYKDILESACLAHYYYLKGGSLDYLRAIREYQTFILKSSKYLVKSSVKQDLNILIISLIVTFLVFMHILVLTLTGDFAGIFFLHTTQLFIIFALFCIYLEHSFMYVAVFLLVVSYIMFAHKRINKKLFSTNFQMIKVLLTVGSVIHALSFASSSFIEEEHQTWYFFSGTFILCNLLNIQNFRMLINYICVFIGLRFLRLINQTGDKWASLPDLSDWLLKSENSLYLQLLFITSLVLCIYCQTIITRHKKICVLDSCIYLLIFIFKTVYSDSVYLGKIIWLLIFINLIASVVYNISLVNTWLLISCLLMQPYNVILIPACVLASNIFSKNIHNPYVLTLAHIWLGNTLYFCQGHSNSLASVNVASGYVGLDTYKPSLVVSQVLCHTYSLPVLAHFLVLQKCRSNSAKVWSTIIIFRLLNLLVVSVLTLVQRNHLFVWSVFAPKLLIESVHCIVLLLEMFLYTSFSKISNKVT